MKQKILYKYREYTPQNVINNQIIDHQSSGHRSGSFMVEWIAQNSPWLLSVTNRYVVITPPTTPNKSGIKQ